MMGDFDYLTRELRENPSRAEQEIINGKQKNKSLREKLHKQVYRLVAGRSTLVAIETMSNYMTLLFNVS